MPRASVIMIRTAFVWLALGSTIGGAMLIHKGLLLWPSLWAVRWAHVHLLLVGWTIQLACGVANWILPRRAVAGWRGDSRLVWLCYIALNLGVISAAIPGSSALLKWRITLDWMYALAGCWYSVAAISWIIYSWTRIIPSLHVTNQRH